MKNEQFERFQPATLNPGGESQPPFMMGMMPRPTEQSDENMFLANMSHEIRTPMNTILGYAQILSREADLSSTHQQNLQSIILSARHLLSLINDVLEISKIDSGRVEVVPSVFDVRMLFQTVDAVARKRLEENHLAFSIDIEESVPRNVLADESKFRQIVVNLVSNAVKYTQQGAVSVRVQYLKDKASLVVLIKDSGPGIPQADIDKIFLPFERSSSNAETEEGTGLGLAISQQFARLLKGEINVVSEMGVGSEFRLVMPVAIPGEGQTEKDESACKRVVGLASHGLRILIVDDNRENALLSGQFLRSVGFDVEVVFSGADGIGMAKRWHPGLVLMDKRMPEIDGLAAMKQIKSDLKTTKVIVVSASPFQEEGEECIVEGADGYIRKPYLEDELLKEISRVNGVRYRYETVKVEPESDGNDISLTLSHNQAAEFESALLSGDIDEILNLIDACNGGSSTRSHLRRLALQFKYEELLALITAAQAEQTQSSMSGDE